MKLSKKELLNLGIAIVPIILALIFYNQLPDQIPKQWGFEGQISYGDKSTIWMIAFMPLFLTFLFHVLPKIDPRRKNYTKFSTQYKNFILFMNVFLNIMVGIILSESMNPGIIQINKVVPVLVGILFMFLGNMMPKFKSNFFMGIKTPWTLSSTEVWNKTHRLGGLLFFVSGIIMVIGTFILKEVWLMYMVLGITFFSAILPSFMSYIWFKKGMEEKKDE